MAISQAVPPSLIRRSKSDGGRDVGGDVDGVVVEDAAADGAIYNDSVVRLFTLAAVLWGVVGMLVGVVIAAQLTWPELNFGISWLSYGRLRPLHTNAVIFAFGGCALMGSSFYVVQRTSQVTLFMPKLAAFVFWGWQLVILGAAISLPWATHRARNTPSWSGRLTC